MTELQADLMRALRRRHQHDVFIDECNVDSAWAGCRRLDAWAMTRSWAHWTCTAYEVKVSRQDFRRDQKWGEALALCHEFFFVSPTGLLKAEDLAPGVGLVWVGRTGMAQIKVRAVRHEPDTKRLNRLLSYALMSRSQIVANMWQANQPATVDRLAQYEAMVRHAEQKRMLTALVQGHIRQRFEDLRRRTEDAERRAHELQALAEGLAQLGIKLDGENRYHWPVMQELRARLKEVQVDSARRALHLAQGTLLALDTELEQIQKGTHDERSTTD